MISGPEASHTHRHREVFLVYVAVWLGTFALSQTEGVPVVGEHRGELVGMLFLVTAMVMGSRIGLERAGLTLGGLMLPAPMPGAGSAERTDTDTNTGADTDTGASTDTDASQNAARPSGADFLGLLDLARGIRAALPAAARETGFALLVALVVFPPFVVGFYLYTEPLQPFAWTNDVGTPARVATWAETLLAQLVMVALPEEAFFRGYVQTRLANAQHATDARLRSPGVLVTQAALFALVHLASVVHVARLAVFFPALLFGWIRAQRGGIGAALVFHALCNLLSEVLTRGWLS